MTESDEFQEKTYIQVLGTVYPFLVKEDIQVSAGSVVTVKLLSAVVDFMSDILDKPLGRSAMDKYFGSLPGTNLAQVKPPAQSISVGFFLGQGMTLRSLI